MKGNKTHLGKKNQGGFFGDGVSKLADSGKFERRFCVVF